jgi:hypothetical protein
MFVTVFVAVSTALIGVGVLEEVVVPAGTYAYETGTELYQEYIVGTE